MPLDPNIALSVKPIGIESPLQTMGGIMQMRELMTKQALHQAEIARTNQQTEEFRAVAEQRNRDLQSTRRLQTVLADPANHDLFAKGDFTPIWKAGVTPNIGMPAVKQIQESGLQTQALATGKAKFYAEGHSLLADTIKGLNPKDDKQAAIEWNSALPRLAETHPEIMSQLKPLEAGPDFRTEINRIAAANGVARSIYENAAAMEKEQASIAETKAKTAKDVAELPKIAAEAGKLQSEGEYAKLKLSGQEPIQPKDTAELARQQAQQAETGRHNKAEEAISSLKVGIQRAKEARENKIFEATYGEGSNPALQGVEPKSRQPALREAKKALDEHTKALAASDAMQSFIDLARQGNKAAYANIPVEGVLEIVTPRGTVRINKQELDAYAGAGSLFDKFAGHVGKVFTGESIPSGVLNNIETMHKKLAEGADTTYDRKLEGVDTLYRSKFKQELRANAPAASAGPKMIKARDDKGKLHEAAEGTPLPPGWKLEGK